MRYAEILPPPALAHFIKVAWTLDCDPDPAQSILHTATPDGCIEIIHRITGGSWWQGPQPAAFVAGVITRPAVLRFTGDARFVAVRLWPWAWNALAAVRSPALVDVWLPLGEAAPDLPPPDPDNPFACITGLLGPETAFGSLILASKTVAELASRTGRSPRWLQRWFARNVGVSPRAYLRLLRFQDALQGIQQPGSQLADEAAAHGYADQAHMTRDFHDLAGVPAGAARRTARGPFV